VAVTTTQKVLLEQQFPSLNFLHFPGYNIKYGRSRLALFFKIFAQIPKIKRCIKDENQWLEKAVETYKFDAVISDNRYGLYHHKIPCIFISHQLTIKSPLGKWSEKYLQKHTYRFIEKFTECWIPDFEDKDNLAGELSHPDKKPAVPLKYIGWLSRFEELPITPFKNNLLVLLSGPEPQRTMMEEKIIKELNSYKGPVTVVRGLPDAHTFIPSIGEITFYNHLPSGELNKVIHEAEFIISRCGYSTAMELILLKKKTIFIPTPGQSEQEYLGKYLSLNHFSFCIDQNKFFLKDALENANNFHYQFPAKKQISPLKIIIQKFLNSVKYKRNLQVQNFS
jgi:uncharacterized protein (TIGR00661 family)